MANPIGWCDKTWNPVTGCSPVSEGCQNCYAERMAKRLKGRYGYPADDPFKVTLHPDRLDQPLKWQKPQRIFVCSMSDLFHDDVPFEFIDQVFSRMALSQRHTFLLMTKPPERMLEYLTGEREETSGARVMACLLALERSIQAIASNPDTTLGDDIIVMGGGGFAEWPLSHVHIGVTAENQERANERIPILLNTPAAVRFVSVEPMLGPVDVKPWIGAYPASRQQCKSVSEACPNEHCSCPSLDWVICGPENGPGARPMNPDWARSLRDQCEAAGVPFYFKGGELDGKTLNQFPEVTHG